MQRRGRFRNGSGGRGGETPGNRQRALGGFRGGYRLATGWLTLFGSRDRNVLELDRMPDTWTRFKVALRLVECECFHLVRRGVACHVWMEDAVDSEFDPSWKGEKWGRSLEEVVTVDRPGHWRRRSHLGVRPEYNSTTYPNGSKPADFATILLQKRNTLRLQMHGANSYNVRARRATGGIGTGEHQEEVGKPRCSCKLCETSRIWWSAKDRRMYSE